MAVWSIVNKADCRECTAFFQKARGCVESLPEAVTIEGYQVFNCPRSFVDSKTEEYIQAYVQWRGGHLPNAGGYMNQTAKFIESMILIDGYMGKFMEKERHGRPGH
ncbi:MAG TPA: hypothetical protein PKL77_10095 [Candidatus Omnitrophota bacterium]|nr:hypothetical protein [Candidatus Omnitrophota bacterium]